MFFQNIGKMNSQLHFYLKPLHFKIMCSDYAYKLHWRPKEHKNAELFSLPSIYFLENTNQP